MFEVSFSGVSDTNHVIFLSTNFYRFPIHLAGIKHRLLLVLYSSTRLIIDNREVKIDVYSRPVTANAKLQVGFSGEVLAVRN